MPAAVANDLSAEVHDLGTPFGLRIDQEFADGRIVPGDEPGSGIFVDEAAIVADAEGTAQAEWQVPDGPHIRRRRAELRLRGENDRDDPLDAGSRPARLNWAA